MKKKSIIKTPVISKETNQKGSVEVITDKQKIEHV